ncbi:MAG: glycosyltransferase family 39 protein [Rhodospirillales bacterium]|nr:glycosyltransferase family 39 protein [Rhodospirillales bacterium]
MSSHPETYGFRKSLFWALGLWVVFGIASVLLRPPFPVDETRYLTVAWEMHLSGDWILPTLNFLPYHHKPPMMFWLVNLFWDLFGVSRFVAAMVPVLFAGLGIVLTGYFARMLLCDDPARDRIAAAAMILMAGSLPLLVYGSLMMFDHMIGVFVLIGLMAVWARYRTPGWRYVLLFGLALGLGVLAKGPVMLLYLAFPVLLAPWWGADRKARGYGWLRWYAGFLGGGVILGAGIALAWAIPAALRGGEEYRDMILWGQTAGRMVQSFDHNRPVWWYLPFVPLFFAPWIFWPGFIKRARGAGVAVQGAPGRFLLCWTIPVLVSFSLISGKQVHYLIPLAPALWIAAGAMIVRASDSFPLRRMQQISAGTVVLMIFGQAVGGLTLFRQFDLVPVAEVLDREGGRPLAWVRNYHGEMGFVASLTEPLEDIEHEDLPSWFEDHPDGIAVMRYRRPEQIAPYTVLYTTPTQYKRRYAVLRPAGAAPDVPEAHVDVQDVP